MTIERFVRLFAGCMVVAGVILAYAVSKYWLILPLFVGLNLAQSSLTGFCPLEKVLRRLGVPETAPPPRRDTAGGLAGS